MQDGRPIECASRALIIIDQRQWAAKWDFEHWKQ